VPASLSEQAGWFRCGMFEDYVSGTTPPNSGGELGSTTLRVYATT